MARSVLSFNDHHIWEVFWMISVLGLFAASINKWSGKKIQENISDKKSLVYPLFTGISLGFYLDTWAPGFIVGLMIVIYAFIVYLLKKWLSAETENLTYISIITFAVASLVYLPFAFNSPGFSTARYSPFQLLILVSSGLVILVFHLIERFESRGFFEKIGIKEDYAFPATVIVSAGIIMGGIALLSPDFLFQLKSIIRVVQPKGGALTVAEVQPFFTMGGKFSLSPAWSNFSITFFFAIPGMLYTVYKLLKERKSLYLLILIWGVAMFIALAGQNRFAYYFAVVSAVFAAVMANAILEKLGFYRFINAAVNNDRKTMRKIGSSKFMVGLLVLIILFYPTFNQANFYSKYSAGGINKQWYDALTWMRENTPGKEMYDEFYYQLYKPPEKLGEPYPYYPEGTYGVMSWWDYGHWITAIAHRIPNANPFQQGIGNKYNNMPGAAPFFTAFNESYADKIADKLGVKYVISDVEMATGKFYAMATWAEGTLEKAGQIYYAGLGYIYHLPDGRVGVAFNPRMIPPNVLAVQTLNLPSENYFRTLEAKLHILDTKGLQHYRMIYESASSANTFSGFQELIYRNLFNQLYASKFGFKPVDATFTGYVKIFEYVKGAKIAGRVPEGVDKVHIQAKIVTNQGRVFVYENWAEVKDGYYEITVPYSQNSKYPVKAEPYQIRAGEVVKTVEVTEEDVLNGKTITVDLI
jgi:dolichyl-diphosphooligosaccharide--protein glycosyltransferase